MANPDPIPGPPRGAAHADLVAAARGQHEAAKAADDLSTDSVTLSPPEPSFSGPPPDSFAGYQILREVHRGGQGVVYQALQKSTNRKVAIKVMKEGPFAGAADRARFEREIQVLGQLKHPNIVAIHDTGVAAGCHFFVMDYISGHSLDVHMASGPRSVERTLRLFAKICEAVNAAHLRGVIHRDLKPGNVRVNGDNEPHILDFGLAKVATNNADAAAMTITGQFVGSLPWASPEQAEGASSKIDIRTDVYSLGVILFQMLTGKFPYEVVGNIRDVLDRIMKAAPIGPRTIRRELNDEVQTIVLKCLAKERERRYQSAGELARDVERYLRHEPIEAKSDSAWYLVRKAVRRHRIPLVFAALAILWLANSIVLMASNLAEARKRQHETQQIADFQAAQLRDIDAPGMAMRLRDDLLAEIEATRKRSGVSETDSLQSSAQLSKFLDGVNVTNVVLRQLDRDVFEPALAAARRQFSEQPLVRARLLQSLADTLRRLGLIERAAGPQAQALEIRRHALGDEHADTIASSYATALLLMARGKLAEAMPHLETVVGLRRRILGEEHPDTLRALSSLGTVLREQSRLAEAEPYLCGTLERMQRVLGSEHPDTLTTMNDTAVLFYYQEKLSESEHHFRTALQGRRRVLGDDHPDTLQSSNDLAVALTTQGKLEPAEAQYLESFERSRRALGDEHPRTLESLHNMGHISQRRGKLMEAERYFRESMERHRRVLGEEYYMGANSEWGLGVVLRDQSRFQEAQPHLLRAERVFRTGQGAPIATIPACLQDIVTLYEHWHTAEPGKGYDAQAAEWRAKLAEWQASTQPDARPP